LFLTKRIVIAGESGAEATALQTLRAAGGVGDIGMQRVDDGLAGYLRTATTARAPKNRRVCAGQFKKHEIAKQSQFENARSA